MNDQQLRHARGAAVMRLIPRFADLDIVELTHFAGRAVRETDAMLRMFMAALDATEQIARRMEAIGNTLAQLHQYLLVNAPPAALRSIQGVQTYAQFYANLQAERQMYIAGFQGDVNTLAIRLTRRYVRAQRDADETDEQTEEVDSE